MKFLFFPQVVQKESISYASGAGLQAQVPDIVSSMIKTNAEATPGILFGWKFREINFTEKTFFP